jgi:hypothetical protein
MLHGRKSPFELFLVFQNSRDSENSMDVQMFKGHLELPKYIWKQLKVESKLKNK